MNKNKLIISSLLCSISIAFHSNIISNAIELDSYKLSYTRKEEPNTWITGLSDMPTGRAYLSSAVVNDKIYVLGGSERAKVEMYDPETDTWETKQPMPTGRSGLASVAIGEKIYSIGGVYNTKDLNSLEVYDTVTNTWEKKTPMKYVRYGLTAQVVDGKIYAIGGSHIGGTHRSAVEMYDPETDTWETKQSMPTPRGYLSSSVVGNKIYVLGGEGGLNTLEVYDTETDTWETKASFIQGRHSFTSVSYNDNIYIIGGDSYRDSMEIYDTTSDTWSTGVVMPTGRGGLTSSVIGNKIYCIGGEGVGSNKVEAFVVEEISLPTPETPANITASMDVYIKSENMLSMSLDTNSITFENFNGVEDIEKLNAVNISVSSSLPYELSAYLPVEIQNSDKSKTMDKRILNIREKSETVYKTFNNINEKLVLKDNNSSGNDLTHNIDLKLKGGLAYEADVYKTTIKFEVNQK